MPDIFLCHAAIDIADTACSVARFHIFTIGLTTRVLLSPSRTEAGCVRSRADTRYRFDSMRYATGDFASAVTAFTADVVGMILICFLLLALRRQKRHSRGSAERREVRRARERAAPRCIYVEDAYAVRRIKKARFVERVFDRPCAIQTMPAIVVIRRQRCRHARHVMRRRRAMLPCLRYGSSSECKRGCRRYLSARRTLSARP